MTKRLLAAFLVVSFVVLAVLIVPLGITRQRSERDDLIRRVEHDAVAVASIAADSLRSRVADYTQLENYLSQYTKRTGARVVVVNGSGIALVDSDAPRKTQTTAARDFSTRSEIKRALNGDVVTGERESQTLGYRLLFVAVPVTAGGRSLGAVRVSYPTGELRERTYKYWYGLIVICLTVLGFASIIGSLVAGWLSRPLERLAAVADAMGEGDLTVRADIDSGPPEVRDLAERINDSVSSLERIVTEQQAFVADASHQLRTPLQALRLRLENAQADVNSGQLEPADGALELALGEVDRLAGLVTALLVMERADRADVTPLEDLDVAQLIGGRVDAWSELGERRSVTITVRVAPGLAIKARAVHVEQVLDNLVDNAVAASPPGEVVEVIARAHNTSVQLHVLDHGPGMTDAQMETAFRRFATSLSVSSSQATGGFGIGLAIVRRLSEIDGGTVGLRHGPHGGVDAVVEYPQHDGD